ncbi:MAG: endolytic transglycosylase MltG [Chromatiaceae bacterium]
MISLSPDDATRPELDPGQPPPARPFRRRRFRHLGFLFLLVVALALAGLWLRFHFDAFKERPLALPATVGPDQPFLFEIPLGMSLRTLAQELTALGVLDQPYYFLALAYLRGDAGRVKAGEYEISPGMTPVALLDKLVKNQVYQRSVTLIEGWTLAQLLAALAKDDRLVGKLEGATPQDLMAALGRAGQYPEGRFFPDTYRFTKGTSDLDILGRAAQAMERVLAEEWRDRAPGLPLENPDQALVLASIIEKETSQASERPTIAGVFIRRLQLGMRLQTDPTVIYGLGAAFDGDLRRNDLTRDTPYNTYTRHGLPPTPIALPGRAAIHAALHPEAGDSLYFVAKGDGGHWFSPTLEEHNQAVRRYQLGQGTEGGKP